MPEEARAFAVDITVNLNVGAAQGVARIGAHYYVYGDRGGQEGVILECDMNAEPTGRTVRLPAPFIHPTGLTHHERYGTFLGNTVQRRGTISRIDWEKALADGTVAGSILNETQDDIANNGCRPEFVELNGGVFLATADYGDRDPAIRLLDPALMQTAHRTSEAGILRHHLPSAPFVQTLWWDGVKSRLVALRNVTSGNGWAIDRIDLEQALTSGSAAEPAERWILPLHSELEGGLRLADGRWMFVMSSQGHNVVIGRIV